MSLLLALLQWLFGRRFQAADYWRLQRADYAAYMLTEILEGGVLWEDPEDRARLLRNRALIEDAAVD